jgi:hypothetical protein
MIAAIKSLDSEQQRQLARMLEPRVNLSEVPDDGVLEELIDVLREKLQVPEKDDLPEYLRRRLIDVAKRHFRLGESFDTLSDMELAEMLVDFSFDAVAQLADDDERRREFVTFLRTKDRRERTRWLVESERLASLVRDGTFDEAAARRRARELHEGGEAHRATARAILGDLQAVEKHTGAYKRRHAAAGSISAAVTSTQTGTVAAAAAVPLSAIAGSLFMAGRQKHDLVRASEKEAPKARAQRARNSRVVQSVIALSAFLTLNAASPDD